MIYKNNKLTYNSIREVFHGPVNDVMVCEELSGIAGSYYTLLVIHEHEAAKKLLEIFEQAKEEGRDKTAEVFSSYGDMCLIFDYQRERPMEQFLIGQHYHLWEAEEICVNLLLECMGSGLAWPILYLILKQKQIHIQKDGSIYFSYQIDLSELDKNKGERECTVCAGGIVWRILQPCAGRKAVSCRLIQKRLERGSYSQFIQLYKDMKLVMAQQRQTKLPGRIRAALTRQQDKLFGLLLAGCIVISIIALAMLIAQVIWGEIPFLRVFYNSLEVIGTQSLLQ